MMIGLAGQRRSGKTTIADLLAERLGLYHMSFAGPMRQFVAGLLDMTPQELEVAKEQPIDWLGGVTPRHMLQTIGTDWGRSMVHPELWVRLAMRRAGMFGECVLSDVRFPNEAEAIHAHGGIVVRLHRDAALSVGAHASETPLPDGLVDLEVDNNGPPCAAVERIARFARPDVPNPGTSVPNPGAATTAKVPA